MVVCVHMLSVGGTFTSVITSVTLYNQGSIAVSNCIQEPACDHRPAHPRLSCQQAHTCVLHVPLATGPGFTGPYNWASGALALRPDPYVAFGMTPTPPSGRRLVSQAVSPDSCSGLAHSAASEQCSVVDDIVSQKQGCGAPGADRILLQTTTTPISSSGGASIQGQVDAKEIGASNLTSSTGGIRSSDQAWVDKTGAIAVVGQVRSGDVPPNRPLSLLQVCSFLPSCLCIPWMRAQGHVLQTLWHDMNKAVHPKAHCLLLCICAMAAQPFISGIVHGVFNAYRCRRSWCLNGGPRIQRLNRQPPNPFRPGSARLLLLVGQVQGRCCSGA